MLASARWDKDRVVFTIAARDAGASLVSVLSGPLGMGKRLAHDWIAAGRVSLNDEVAAPHAVLAAGDRLTVVWNAPEHADFAPDTSGVAIVYEDDHVLVADKPAGIVVHPNAPEDRGTLVHRVLFHLLAQGCEVVPHPVHRLDQHTSGGVLFAKHAWAHVRLDAALRDGAVKRRYVAVAHGQPKKKSFIVSAPIGRDRHHPTRRRVSPGGQPATTRGTVVERYADAALLRLELETGRTHQIRVHMQHIGNPLLGDSLYGGSDALFRRPALHAERLVFPHPMTDEPIACTIPWPDDLQRLVERLRGGG